MYREVRLERTPHLRSLHRALKKSPQRALFIRKLILDDRGCLTNHVSEIQEILLKLANLVHLNLGLNVLGSDEVQYRDMIRTLNKCPFSLTSFEGLIYPDTVTAEFFRRQSSIVFLNTYTACNDIYNFADWALPADVLPQLKYLQVPHYLIENTFRAHRMVTHLDLSFLPVRDDELLQALSVFQGQLVGLKYARFDSCIEEDPLAPSQVLQLSMMPKLKHLDLMDFMHDKVLCLHSIVITAGTDRYSQIRFTPNPSLATLAHLANPDIVLDTLVWRVLWAAHTRREQREGLPEDRAGRVEHIRRWVRPLLEMCPSLRRVFYCEMDNIFAESCVVLFTLSAPDGALVEERRSVRELPTWREEPE